MRRIATYGRSVLLDDNLVRGRGLTKQSPMKTSSKHSTQSQSNVLMTSGVPPAKRPAAAYEHTGGTQTRILRSPGPAAVTHTV